MWICFFMDNVLLFSDKQLQALDLQMNWSLYQYVAVAHPSFPS